MAQPQPTAACDYHISGFYKRSQKSGFLSDAILTSKVGHNSWVDDTCQKTGLGTQVVSAGITRRYRKETGVLGEAGTEPEWSDPSQISQGAGARETRKTAGAGAQGGWGLTLVQRRRHTALHPRRVVVHNIDGDVGVPVGDDLHGTIVLGPLREDGVRWGWRGRPRRHLPASF